MAVLAKIRQRSLFLIIVIALALFSFVLADLFKGGGIDRDSNNVGSVNGEDLPYQDFRVQVDNVNKSMGRNSNSSLYAANYVWNQEVRRKIVKAQYDDLGLNIGQEALVEAMRIDPSIGQNQLFLNENKEFDENKFKEYIASIKASNNDQWRGWKKYEKQVEQSALEKIYFNLVKSGINATTIEGKTKYQIDNNKVSFQFVNYPFSAIADTTIAVTPAEIAAYIKKNSKEFKSDATRDIQFVYIEEKPSAADINEVQQAINKLLVGGQEFSNGETVTKPGFAAVTNVEEFVNDNSEIKFDSTYVAKDKLPASHQDQIFNLAVNEVYGPYENDGYSQITRLLDKKDGGQVKASHILLSYVGAMRAKPTVTRTKEEAKALAEELLAKIQKDPTAFTTSAVTNSDDSSASNGGDLGFFSPGQMVPAFNDYVFNTPVGKIGLVETDFGFHVLKATDTKEAVQIATIALKIETSEATSNQLYNDVSNFEMKASEGVFDTIAKELKYDIKKATKLTILAETIPEVGNQREIVKWAFNESTSTGDVKRFNLPKGYVVAQVTAQKEEGLQSAEEAESKVKPILIKEKKVAQAKTIMTGNFEAIKTIEGVKSGTASNLSVQSPYVPNAGREAKLVAYASTLEPNTESTLIEGETGVFMIKVTTQNKAIELPDYNSYVLKEQSAKGNITEPLYNTLKEGADITDNRHLFY